MKNLFGVSLIGMFLGASAFARVTPAHLALQPVKQFLDAQMEQAIRDLVPQVKAANHIVMYRTNFMRGKFSETEGGFSDFFGDTEVTVQIGMSQTFYDISCQLAASAQVVPFAMQMVPILEETTNEEQLILRRHEVSCRVVSSTN